MRFIRRRAEAVYRGGHGERVRCERTDVQTTSPLWKCPDDQANAELQFAAAKRNIIVYTGSRKAAISQIERRIEKTDAPCLRWSQRERKRPIFGTG
ncbi:MAG: hypothetical protein ACLRSW_12395 [Christensenellaceae bacterium]